MMQIPEGYPEILALIARANYDALRAAGVAADPATDIAFAVAERVRKDLGGGDFYVPKGEYWEADVRADEIWRKFNGRNYAELAQAYDLTEMRIRQIVANKRAADVKKRQGTLL